MVIEIIRDLNNLIRFWFPLVICVFFAIKLTLTISRVFKGGRTDSRADSSNGLDFDRSLREHGSGDRDRRS